MTSASVILVLTACGSDGAIDAAPRDSQRLDGHPPLCEVVAPTPPPPSHSATVVFDKVISGLDRGDVTGYPIAAFSTTDGVMGIGRFRTFTVSLDGSVAVGPSYPANPDGDVAECVGADAASGDGYGLVLNFWNGDYRFCRLDVAGVSTTCHPLVTGYAFPSPRVSFDGSLFHVVDQDADGLHRWRFSSDGAALGDDELWPRNPDQHVLFGIRTPSGEPVALVGDLHDDRPCPTARVQSRVDTHGADLFTTEFRLDGTPAITEAGASVRVLAVGRCIVGGSLPCDGPQLSDEGITLQATVTNGDTAVGAPIAVDRNSRYITFPDANDVAVTYFADGALFVAVLGSSGEMRVNGTPLPVGSDAAVPDQVYAGVALAPLDYVVVYGAETPGGPAIRTARVTLAGL